jgi:hypothetical protein
MSRMLRSLDRSYPEDSLLVAGSVPPSFGAMHYIPELRATIQRLHKCEASHTRTEAVRQTIQGELLWEGNVEVFALLGHDAALRCYAWGNMNEESRWEVTTVLAIPPVVSSETAVLAAIAAKIKAVEAEREAGDLARRQAQG